ncbi:hypothetical protein SKAU_G00015680 [Synaphobranchus kaupii]|uniref:Uncharacterized protein n=1 Tax=Synaphobranchus kaupii TaxID=118154 RepID=A0A9Q1JDD8_SYNKA|nr:hypothetical protein SKAU_G00015680 [Synaphobranchus kaupii]
MGGLPPAALLTAPPAGRPRGCILSLRTASFPRTSTVSLSHTRVLLVPVLRHRCLGGGAEGHLHNWAQLRPVLPEMLRYACLQSERELSPQGCAGPEDAAGGDESPAVGPGCLHYGAQNRDPGYPRRTGVDFQTFGRHRRRLTARAGLPDSAGEAPMR